MSEMQMEASLLCPQAAVEIAASSVVQRTVWVRGSHLHHDRQSPQRRLHQ